MEQKETVCDVGQNEAHTTNLKNVVDLHVNLTANALKQAQQELAQINSVTLSAIERSNNLVIQAQQNAIETANMVSKQSVRHSDIAIDRQWNVDEQGYTAQKILGQPFVEAINAAVAAAVAKSLSKN